MTVLMIVTQASVLHAKDIVESREQRADEIRRAVVWQRPPWIDANFRFSSQLNVLRGTPVKGAWNLLENPTVTCETNDELIGDKGNGKTSKFKCELLNSRIAKQGQKPDLALDKKNEPIKIKVKYGKTTEIFAEVAATRLLEALGFGADRMFFVAKTECYGCGKDPKKDLTSDSSTLLSPQVFTNTSIEKKHEGDEIMLDRGANREPKKGWNWKELMALGPTDPIVRKEQMIQRDALRLLSSFLEHTDNKAENQRLVCLGEKTAAGCGGQTLLMIQDIGIAFGGGVRFIPPQINHFSLKKWRDRRFWANASTCQSGIGITMTTRMWNPHISEEGRAFLVKLFDGFTAGTEGRKRVGDLFRAGHFELTGQGTIEEWVDAFYIRYEQMKYPMGRQNPDFKCPKSVDDFK